MTVTAAWLAARRYLATHPMAKVAFVYKRLTHTRIEEDNMYTRIYFGCMTLIFPRTEKVGMCKSYWAFTMWRRKLVCAQVPG